MNRLPGATIPGTIQRLPTTHKDYAKWKAATEKFNSENPAFRINFESKWSAAVDIGGFIGVLKNAQRLVAERNLPKPPSVAFTELPKKIEVAPIVRASPSVYRPSATEEQKAHYSLLFNPTPVPSSATQVYVAPDPFAGLVEPVKGWAQGINAWTQSSMAGIPQVNMTQTQQESLTTWVLGRRTGGANQKFIVIIGQGSGTYATHVQYKVIGRAYAATSGTAMTYHIALTTSSYRPAILPATFGV